MNQLLSSTKDLQADIQKCLSLLINARLNHDKVKEAETPEEVATNIQEFITRMEDKYIKEDY